MIHAGQAAVNAGKSLPTKIKCKSRTENWQLTGIFVRDDTREQYSTCKTDNLKSRVQSHAIFTD